MGNIPWHNRPMRWPWTGLQEVLETNQREYARIGDELTRFTEQLIADMQRKAEEREREVNRRLEEIRAESRAYRARTQIEHEEMIAELRAGRDALFRMLDRLPPPEPGTA
jgi:molecular chaperone GrpE (heat shock protein)